jgi:hypothetical protein
MSDTQAKPDKPKPSGKPHDVLAAADQAAKLPNGRPRMNAIFDVVAAQIKADIELAKQQPDKETAIAVFERNYEEYQRNKGAVLDKLDALVRG